MLTQSMVGERTLRIRSSALDGAMAFSNCDEVVKDLSTILRGWGIRQEADGSQAPAIVRLKRTSRGYLRVSPWVNSPSECREAFRSHGTDALFGVHYDLLKWYVMAQRTRPCVHSAAVRFASGLVVFPNTTRAGKTTLTVELARAGHQVFCDDWLPIEQPGSFGMALGILPWLRLPVPVEVRDGFREFLRARRGPGNRRWVYVNLRAHELAVHGETAPVGGLVLLDRQTTGKARLVPVSKDKMLTELIEQNYAQQLPAMEIFDKLHALAQGTECFSLQYASVGQAASVLQGVFGRPQ